MSSQPCSSQDFLEINKSKEYTLIATSILESVLTDKQLNAQSVQLWQLLFNQARYNPDLSIKISYGYLSKKLGKSTRTIARYTELLQKAGYIVIAHNFDKNGGQRPSTLSIRVPQTIIKNTLKKKDRCHKNGSHSDVLLIKERANVLVSSQETLTLEQQSITSPNIENVLHETLTPENAHQSNTPCFDTASSENNILERKNSLVLQDKTVREGHDINDIQKDKNKKEINNNNNNVVVLCSKIEPKKRSIQECKDKIDSLEKQLSEGNLALTYIKDHVLIYEQIRKNSALEASLHLARIALERLLKEVKTDQIEQEAQKKLSSDHSFMSGKPGSRSISPFAFNRLVKSLRCYGYQGSKLNCLLNEVVFEARFGSLVNCNKTKKPLSLENAINIALKLVRENRWSTPTLLQSGS